MTPSKFSPIKHTCRLHVDTNDVRTSDFSKQFTIKIIYMCLFLPDEKSNSKNCSVIRETFVITFYLLCT